MEFLASLHHKIIHFPIAFLVIYPFVEMLAVLTGKDFFVKSAGMFLLIGTVGALLAALTGNQAYSFIQDWPDAELKLFYLHQTFANVTIWYFAILLASRFYFSIKKKLNKKLLLVFLILSIMGSYFVYQTANYGGKISKERLIITTENN